MKKIKILITTSTFPCRVGDSGSPFVYELAKGLVQQNIDITVLAPHARDAKREEVMDGMKVYRYQYLPSDLESLAYEGGMLSKLKTNKLNYLQIPFFLFFQLVSICKIVKNEGIDVIHAHWIIPQGLMAVCYKKIFNSQIKIICTSHGSDLLGLKGFILTFLKKFVLKNIDRLTVVSNLLKDEALRFKRDLQVSVLPMGVDFDNFKPERYSPEIRKEYAIDGPFLLFVGRLSEEKGVKYLIEAMPGIVKVFPKTKLLILGAGELEAEFKVTCQQLNMTHNIVFVGHVPHDTLAGYYATADILIGPSLHEGLGLVFIEAIACGCVVVASNLPSIAEFIIDGKTGFLVKPFSAYEIEKKVLGLLEHPDWAATVKMSGRGDVILRFNHFKICEQYGLILTKVVSSGVSTNPRRSFHP